MILKEEKVSLKWEVIFWMGGECLIIFWNNLWVL